MRLGRDRVVKNLVSQGMLKRDVGDAESQQLQQRVTHDVCTAQQSKSKVRML